MEQKVIVWYCTINWYEAYDLSIDIKYKDVSFLKKEYLHLAVVAWDVPDYCCDLMHIQDRIIITLKCRDEIEIKGNIIILQEEKTIVIWYDDIRVNVFERGYDSEWGHFMVKIELKNCSIVITEKWEKGEKDESERDWIDNLYDSIVWLLSKQLTEDEEREQFRKRVEKHLPK